MSPEVDFMAQDDVEDLIIRLADLMAADELNDLPWGVMIRESGSVAIEVNERWAIVGRLDHVPQSANHDARRSTRVRIDDLERRDTTG